MTGWGRWRRLAPGRDEGEWEAESRAVLAHAAAYDPRWLVQYGARTGSTWAREVFAHQITDGTFDAAQLSEVLSDPEAAARAGSPRYRTDGLLRYARMLASTRDVDRPALDVLLDHLAPRVRGRKNAWTPSNLAVLAELYARAGRPDDTRAALVRRNLDDVARRLMEADAINPWLARGTSDDEGSWLRQVNGWFDEVGLAPLALSAPGPTPFDRLSAVAPGGGPGPLVSVLMSCFRPGPEAITAVRSIVEQTWGDWELLVLDDASGPAYDEVLGRIAALDDRIRVVRASDNAGTYTRRNEGLALARGELVTIQDSDDWAHPQRLEHQVRHLQEHPELPANWLSCLRCSERLEFVNDRTGRVSISPAEPTLMFRREPVVERIGYWDPIRRAADREYRQRIETVFGCTVSDVTPGAPLLVYRVLSTSLSSPDFTGNWVHPARLAYRSAFCHWHRRIADGADPHLPHPLTERPYPAPARFVDGSTEEHRVDVLVLLDVRAEANPDGLVDTVVDEVEGLLAAGVRVGLAHVESLAATTGLGVFPDRLQALVQSGRLVRVLLEGDDTDAGRVVVRTASVLQGQPARALPVRTDRVVLVEDQVSGRDRRRENYALAEVLDTARAMFGVEPVHLLIDSPQALAAAYDAP